MGGFSITSGGRIELLLFSIVLVLLMGSTEFVEGAEYSKQTKVKNANFSFLKNMKDQANKDMKIKIPGANHALEVISFVSDEKDGNLFSVDSEDQFIGTEVQLTTGQRIYKGLANKDEEQIVVDYYFRTEMITKLDNLLRDGEQQKLLEETMQFVKVYPKYPGGWIKLGYVNLALGKPSEAKTNFAKSLQLAPQSPHAFAGVAISELYLNNGKLTNLAENKLSLLQKVDPNLLVFKSDEIKYMINIRGAEWSKIIEPSIREKLTTYESPLKETLPNKPSLTPKEVQRLEQILRDSNTSSKEKKEIIEFLDRSKKEEPLSPEEKQRFDSIIKKVK